MKEIRRKLEVKIAEIQDQRLRIKQQKYDRSARSKVEKKLKSVWEGSTLLGDEFLALSETKSETLRKVMEDHAHLHDMRIEHVWFQDGEVIYHGSRTKETQVQDSHDHSRILVGRGD